MKYKEILNLIFKTAEDKGYSVAKDRKFNIFYYKPEPKTKIGFKPDFIFTKDNEPTHIFIRASPNYKQWAAKLAIADLVFTQENLNPYFFLLYWPAKNYQWSFNNLSTKLIKNLKPKLNNIKDKCFPLDLSELNPQKTNLEELLKL